MGNIQLATPPATTPANKVVMAVLGASNRSMDSMTNREEDKELQKLLKVRHRLLPPATVFVHLSEYVPIGIPMFRYMNQSERRALHDPTTALHSKLIFPQKLCYQFLERMAIMNTSVDSRPCLGIPPPAIKGIFFTIRATPIRMAHRKRTRQHDSTTDNGQ